METEAYGISCGERKKIEALFGEAKYILSMVRLRLRGLTVRAAMNLSHPCLSLGNVLHRSAHSNGG